MKSILSMAAICIGLLFSPALSAAENANNFVVPLTTNTIGPKEVVTEASGQVVLQFDAEKDELHYQVWVDRLFDVAMAHLHLGSYNIQGPRIAWLHPAGGNRPLLVSGKNDGLLASGTLKGSDLIGPMKGMALEDLVGHLRGGQIYVDVHTSGFITGELSGRTDSRADMYAEYGGTGRMR